MYCSPSDKLIKDAIDKKTGITNIVIYKLDRLARNVVDSLNSMQYFKEKKVAVHFVSYGGTSLNTNSAIGSFLLTTLSAVAELERTMISDRTRDALQSMKRQGKLVGGVPVGMKVNKIQNGTDELGMPKYDKFVVPDPAFDVSKKIIAENKGQSLRFIQGILPHRISLNSINQLRASV